MRDDLTRILFAYFWACGGDIGPRVAYLRGKVMDTTRLPHALQFTSTVLVINQRTENMEIELFKIANHIEWLLAILILEINFFFLCFYFKKK